MKKAARSVFDVLKPQKQEKFESKRKKKTKSKNVKNAKEARRQFFQPKFTVPTPTAAVFTAGTREDHTTVSRLRFEQSLLSHKIDQGNSTQIKKVSTHSSSATFVPASALLKKTIQSKVPETINKIQKSRKLNAAQAQIVQCPADECAVAQAAAGTGKTHSIIERVNTLIRSGSVEPEEILLVTFSVKACAELRERIDDVLGVDIAKNIVVKTFHSLSYAWISRFHVDLGYSRRPQPITTDAAKGRIMFRTIDRFLVEPKRLARCAQKLKLTMSQVTWNDIYSTMEAKNPEQLIRIRNDAKLQILDKFDEAFVVSDSATRLIEALTRKFVYRDLLNKPDTDQGDALTKKYLNPGAIKDFVNFSNQAILRGDDPREYLHEEATVLSAFERVLKEEGAVTFEYMLAHMEKLLREHETARKAFGARHRVIIVDEFQDNNAIQSRVLSLMATTARGCMVVGDEDQAIYSFQGAQVGNFERFADWCIKTRGHVRRLALTQNYRSVANILTVGKALIPNSDKRLDATKPAGARVTILSCRDEKDQASCIVDDVLRHHREKKIPFSDIAILFRCFKLSGSRLHHDVQLQLGQRGIPFLVVGSTSLFQQALAQDLISYLTLACGPSNAAFERVFNTPKRRLSKKVWQLLEDASSHAIVNGQVLMCFESTARVLAVSKSGSTCILTTRQKAALRSFLTTLDEIRRACKEKRLVELIEFVWDRAGFAAALANKANGKRLRKVEHATAALGNDNDDDDDESSNDELSHSDESDDDVVPAEAKRQKVIAERTGTPIKRTNTVAWPDSAAALRTAADAFVNQWQQEHPFPEKDSLFCRAARCLETRRSELPYNPNDFLPEQILEMLSSPRGIGPCVVTAFVAHMALQTSGNTNETGQAGNCVVLSTIHRAKGLEWSVVAVPYLNEGIFPCTFRSKEDTLGGRHREDCPRRQILQGKETESCTCKEHYKDTEAERKHFEEEQRLAHVAATRAKNSLHFYKCLRFYSRESRTMIEAPTSRFEDNIKSSNVVESFRSTRADTLDADELSYRYYRRFRNVSEFDDNLL